MTSSRSGSKTGCANANATCDFIKNPPCKAFRRRITSRESGAAVPTINHSQTKQPIQSTPKPSNHSHKKKICRPFAAISEWSGGARGGIISPRSSSQPSQNQKLACSQLQILSRANTNQLRILISPKNFPKNFQDFSNPNAGDGRAFAHEPPPSSQPGGGLLVLASPRGSLGHSNRQPGVPRLTMSCTACRVMPW